MTSRVRIVPAEIGHVYRMAANLRPEDAAEAVRFDQEPRWALRQFFRYSLIVRTAFVDGKIAAMWGLKADLLSDTGHLWLITTPAARRMPVTLIRQARREVAEIRGAGLLGFGGAPSTTHWKRPTGRFRRLSGVRRPPALVRPRSGKPPRANRDVTGCDHALSGSPGGASERENAPAALLATRRPRLARLAIGTAAAGAH